MTQKILLLSIQPKIVKEIFDGEKAFEFRKRLPNMDSLEISRKVIIYCSSPIMKIYGSFKVGRYMHSNFDQLMKEIDASIKYKNRISKYFTDKTSCYAMSITEPKLYENPISLSSLKSKFPGFVPGQSYRYLDEEIAKLIIRLNGSL